MLMNCKICLKRVSKSLLLKDWEFLKINLFLLMTSRLWEQDGEGIKIVEGLILTLVFKLNLTIGKIWRNLYKNIDGIFAENIPTACTEEPFMEHFFLELGQLKRFSRELIKTKKGVNLLNQNLQNHRIPKKEKRKILMKMMNDNKHIYLLLYNL